MTDSTDYLLDLIDPALKEKLQNETKRPLLPVAWSQAPKKKEGVGKKKSPAGEFAARYTLFFRRYHVEPTFQNYRTEYDSELSEEQWTTWIETPSFHDYLVKQGVREWELSPQTLKLVDILTDPNYPNFQTRLKVAGVTQETFNVWRQNPEFLNLLNERANKVTETERYAVLTSLAQRASTGSTPAQKMFLEMTGDYVPTSNINAKVDSTSRETILALLEILQRYLSPTQLESVAKEFEAKLGTLNFTPQKMELLLDLD